MRKWGRDSKPKGERDKKTKGGKKKQNGEEGQEGF